MQQRIVSRDNDFNSTITWYIILPDELKAHN